VPSRRVGLSISVMDHSAESGDSLWARLDREQELMTMLRPGAPTGRPGETLRDSSDRYNSRLIIISHVVSSRCLVLW
jgi:hypothetical protein